MTSFTDVFGGDTVYPSDVSLLPVALTADITLDWPLETSGAEDVLSSILDVTPSANGWVITLPDATRGSPGRAVLFNNLSGTYNFLVKDNAGATLATIAAGEQWEMYLAVNTTAAGTWRIFRFGASTATVQPSSLVGYGMVVTGSTLSQSMPVTTFSTTGLTVATSNRGGAMVWTGAGAGTLNLLAAASAGNNFFVAVRNEGGGNLTIDPNGSETVNSDTTLVLSPGDSCLLITDGSNWYTIGFGQDATFIFDYTSISVTGGTKTLAGSELNRIAYKFVGILTSNQSIVVPSTIQQYWVDNATTGSFTLGLKTAAGTIVTVPQGSRGIYYCDGTNIIKADTASIATPFAISDGGTGATTASAARLSLGVTAFADAIVTAANAASVRTTIAAAASGANNDITSLAALSTALTAAQGGTGITSYAVGDLIYASGATALAKLADVATGNVLLSGGVTTAPAWGKVGLTTHISGTLAVGNGGTGATTLTGIVKGNGTGAFTAVTAPAGTIVGTSDTQTLTNKRVSPRIGTTASSATPTPDADAHDQYNVTALAAGATFGAPTGTPTDGQKLTLRVKDNGTARTLAFNAIYRALGATLPTTTVINKTVYIGCIYNAADSKWDVVSVAQEL